LGECDHSYTKLGYLIVSRGDPRTTLEARYVCPKVVVYQCSKCGDVLISTPLWERVLDSGTGSGSV